ncbi:hypothetical protein [Maritimibacter sp. DP1N21-5]|uniref:hypothetical protein n=1 Tax=Maritimibacter sp. DP1N21-5 TaxID=2836867 RepID=UPI001C47D508|nr:hypothetical protein [Maritimibacter sp. DP1N21-5]MBV7407999.1 hypothetical protein [Maritimibacter sp. DP1N21-5]
MSSFGPYTRAGLALVFAPLYAGPFLAGLAGHPPAALPVFALLFLLFIAMTRRPDLHQPAGWVTLVFMAAVQLVLVGLTFGLGQLVATILPGLVPTTLPVWLPLVITALASCYGVWAYSTKAEMDVFLDSALERLADFDSLSAMSLAEAFPEPEPRIAAAVDRALADLRALPEDARVGEIDPIVQRLEMTTDAEAFDPLYDAAGEVDGHQDRRIDLGLLRYVASPRVRRQLVERGDGGLAATLLLNAPEPSIRAEARALVWTLLDDRAPADQLPDPDWLADLAREFPDEGFDRLASALAPRT